MDKIYLIYDAQCRFCNRCRKFAEQRAEDEILFIDYKSPQTMMLLKAYPELYQIRAKTIIALAPGIEPSIKFQACREIAQRMNAPWPKVAYLLSFVPSAIGDLFYDLVAKSRPLF